MITFLKFAHIATISLWAAGLVCLPFLFAQRKGVPKGGDLDRIHSLVRFFYIVILSPSAFIAIGTGTALIFLQQTFEAWFLLKLVAVGVMVLIHIASGMVILSLFTTAMRYSAHHYILFTASTLAVIFAILFLVSGKPSLAPLSDVQQWFVPGALEDLLAPFMWWRDQ